MEQASGDDVPRGRALPATDLPRPNPGPSETQHDLSITARPPSSQPAGDGASQDVVPAPLPNTSGPATSQPTAAAAPASQPGSNQFANDPARTHRKWSPRYGRVQKCDFCNGRSPGTLHVCDTCLLHICEGCARRGAWHTESKHFIDPDACDWTPKKQPRKRKDRGSKRRRDDSPSGASGASGPTQRRRLSGPSRGDDGDGVDADNEPHRPAPGQYHSRTSSPFPAAPHGAGRTTPLPPPLANQAQFPAPSSPAQVAGTARPFPDAGPPGTAEGDLRHHRRHRRPSQGPAPFITAASARPNVRQAAARALVGMSQQAYRAYRAQADDDDDDDDDSEENNGREEEEEEKGHAAARRSDQPPRRTAPGARTGGGGGSTRASTTPTTPGMRGSSRPSTPSAAAAEPDPLVVAGLPPGTPGGRDRLVVDLYRDIFGAPPDPSVSRVRTTIPDRWDGDWPAHPGREPGRPYGPYGPYGAPHAPPPSLHPPPPPPLSVHEQYHRELFTATTQFAQHVPPPPRGYGHYSFHNFPAYPPSTPSTAAYGPPAHPNVNNYDYNPNSSPYQPTSRTTPAFHPHNELTPSELQLLHHDRALLGQLQQAWRTHPLILRLRASANASASASAGGDDDGSGSGRGNAVFALGLLWDVFELRRARVLVRDFSMTVRWFVEEKRGLLARPARSVVPAGRGSGGGLGAAGRRGVGEGEGDEDEDEDEDEYEDDSVSRGGRRAGKESSALS